MSHEKIGAYVLLRRSRTQESPEYRCLTSVVVHYQKVNAKQKGTNNDPGLKHVSSQCSIHNQGTETTSVIYKIYEELG